jgi:hypothetical protein
MTENWWWHLWHDPMNQNPWSLLAMIISITLPLVPMLWIENLRSRRRARRKDAHRH